MRAGFLLPLLTRPNALLNSGMLFFQRNAIHLHTFIFSSSDTSTFGVSSPTRTTHCRPCKSARPSLTKGRVLVSFSLSLSVRPSTVTQR